MKPDPLGDLTALARAAAEAGLDWRSRLRSQWLPELVRRYPEAVLRRAIAEAGGRPPDLESPVQDAVEAAIVAMLVEAGYD